MTAPSPARPRAERPPFGVAGLRLGAAMTVPLAPGVVTFGLAFGALAAQKGLTFAETVAMSAIVFAGMSQMLALEVWREPLTIGLVVAMVSVVTAVNARMVLMGASLRPWLGPLPFHQIFPSLYLLTDANWIMSVRYHAEGGRDWGVFVGSGVMLWVLWVGATVPGFFLGALFTDPARFGLDLVMPAFFVAMLVPLYKGPRRAAPWVVAGAAALVTSWVVPGHWFVVVGALAGAFAGAAIDE